MMFREKLKQLTVILLVSLLTACASSTVKETSRLTARDVLSWDQAERDIQFRTTAKHPETRTIRPSTVPFQFILGPTLELEEDVLDYMHKEDIVGLLVLHKGQVLLEKYERGLRPDDSWAGFSMTKSILSTLVGHALADGQIKSLQTSIADYVPALKGTHLEPISIQDLLSMKSGLDWNESYLLPWSDVWTFDSFGSIEGSSPIVTYMKTLSVKAPPGERFNYSTGDSNLLAIVLSNAVGMSLSEYLSLKIWSVESGMSDPANWGTDEAGYEIGGCCFSATLRDYARFGHHVMSVHRRESGSKLFQDYMQAATQSGTVEEEAENYGYQWHTFKSGAFRAVGIYGQEIAISPDSQLVIVTLSNTRSPTLSRKSRVRRHSFMNAVGRAISRVHPPET